MVNRVDWRVDPVLVFHSVPLPWYVILYTAGPGLIVVSLPRPG
jgi:hypothetical protein